MRGTILFFSLLLAAVASSAYLCMLGWNNALALDDYGYVYLIENAGLWGMIKTAYMGWQCRFSTFFVNGLFLMAFGRAKNLIGVTLLMLVSGWTVSERLFTGINRKYGLDIPRRFVVLASILFVNVGIMAYLEPATFFWLCALNYTISVWMTMLLVYALFFCSAALSLRWVLIILSSAYISGTAENFTPLVIMVLGFVFVYRIFGRNRSIPKKRDDTNFMLFVSLAIMGLGFLAMLFGPGNKNRLNNGGEELAIIQMSVSGMIGKTVKASCILLLRWLSRGGFFILMLPLFFGIGAMCNSGTLKKITIVQSVFILVLLFLFIVISVAACVVGIGWYAPPRAYCFLSFIILAVCAYLSTCWGIRVSNKRTAQWAIGVSSLVGLILFVFMIVRDVPLAAEYHDYVTSRNAQIEERGNAVDTGLDTADSPFFCEPFGQKWRANTYSSLRNFINVCFGKTKRYYEPQMLLMESSLGDDAGDWRNRDLQNYYHVQFDIVCQNSHSQ